MQVGGAGVPVHPSFKSLIRKLHEILVVHSNSPNPGALGPGTARNSEMSVSGNSQSSTSLYIVSYRHKLLLYMYMYTTIKNTSSVTILWKILCNFVA